ncbi:MAG: endolytic transglycosylase MltG [Armatimonadota bacterium]|nr:endolytic transglycosylase MltG [Armatimonadota bacterium]
MARIKEILATVQVYILILVALLAASTWALNWVSSPISNDNTPVMVTIPKGASGAEIARRLKDAGLIRSRLAFIYTVRTRRAGEMLKPGEYELRRSMSLLEIIEKLERGEVAAASITIPEGYTVRQIAHLLGEKGIVNEKEFLYIALHGAGRFKSIVAVPSPSLEGYIFPETYQFPRKLSPDFVIREMLAVFNKKVAEQFRQEIQDYNPPQAGTLTLSGGEFKYNLHEIITMASIVEREARTDEDRPLIASVINNRLRKGIRLQIDATVQYAMGEHRPRLFFRDYKTPSPYNTYLCLGLPPGPIANPGIKSIEAVLYPATTDYLYYVANGDGSHVFTRTLEEHAQAVSETRTGRQNSQ